MAHQEYKFYKAAIPSALAGKYEKSGQRRRLAARERTCYECTSARGSRADAGRRRRPAAMNVPPGLGGARVVKPA